MFYADCPGVTPMIVPAGVNQYPAAINSARNTLEYLLHFRFFSLDSGDCITLNVKDSPGPCPNPRRGLSRRV
ncbi:MAG: hypothetical protein K6U80_17815 [Firmicutes bacterium]|nr:hypothetical protein [Bacillota bacterium]